MLTRRRLLQSAALAGASLLIGVRLDGRPTLAAGEALEPNAFVRIAPAGNASGLRRPGEGMGGLRRRLPPALAGRHRVPVRQR
jgi:hypothetical protein